MDRATEQLSKLIYGLLPEEQQSQIRASYKPHTQFNSDEYLDPCNDNIYSMHDDSFVRSATEADLDAVHSKAMVKSIGGEYAREQLAEMTQ